MQVLSRMSGLHQASAALCGEYCQLSTPLTPDKPSGGQSVVLRARFQPGNPSCLSPPPPSERLKPIPLPPICADTSAEEDASQTPTALGGRQEPLSSNNRCPTFLLNSSAGSWCSPFSELLEIYPLETLMVPVFSTEWLFSISSDSGLSSPLSDAELDYES